MTSPTTSENPRMMRGLAALAEVEGAPTPSVLTNMADIAPDLARMTVEFGYGDVFTRPGLGRIERQLATVAALTAMGTAPAQVRFHITGALNVGCTPQQIVEAIIHVCLYAGFPATLNAMTIAREVFGARELLPLPTDDLSRSSRAADKTDTDEPDTDEPATERARVASRYELGWATLTEVDGDVGHRVIASLADIAPDLGRFLIEFAFGDVYPRPGLDLRLREIVTVAACAAMGCIAPQLKVHIHGLLNVGGTREELVEIITQMAVYAGFPAALNAVTAAREVLQKREQHQP